MRIRTRVAGVVAGAAFAGLTALAMGTAAPAGAQPIQPTHQTVSVASQHAQSCWGGDCDDDWDDWGGGWGGGGWDNWGWGGGW